MKRVLDSTKLHEFRNRYLDHTIVIATGVFDVVHPGHIHFLEKAKEQGDILVVGLNSDRITNILKSKPGDPRPKKREGDRTAVIAGLRATDFVFVFDEADAANAIRSLQPDVYVVFVESIPESGEKPEITAAEEIGSLVVKVERHGGDEMSTTHFFEQVTSRFQQGDQ